MNNIDRVLRLVLVAAVAVLYFTNLINGTLAIILGIGALIFFLTSLTSTCPIYSALGLSTLKKNK